jgi:hypothetical protein
MRSSRIALCGLLSGHLSGLISSLPSIVLTLGSNREELGKSDRYFLKDFRQLKKPIPWVVQVWADC